MTTLRLLTLATAFSLAACSEPVVQDPVEVASAGCASTGPGQCTTGAAACSDWPGYACCTVKGKSECVCVHDASRCE